MRLRRCSPWTGHFTLDYVRVCWSQMSASCRASCPRFWHRTFEQEPDRPHVSLSEHGRVRSLHLVGFNPTYPAV